MLKTKTLIKKTATFLKENPHAFWLFLYVAAPVLYFFIEHLPLTFKPVYCSLDDLIPLSEFFIIPYLLWFAFAAFTNIYLLILNKRDFLRSFALQISGFLVSLIIFIVYPTSFPRPDLNPNGGFFRWLTWLILRVDRPRNVLPSLHVYVAVACSLGLIFSKNSRFPKWAKTASAFLAALISASTVFIKQHSVLDIAAAFVLLAVLAPAILLIFGRHGQ